MQLFSFEVSWARVAFATIFPGSVEEHLASAGSMDVERFIQGTCAHFTLRAALGLRLAIWVATLAPLFLLGRLATLRGLPPADRERVLDRLASSDTYAVRSLALLLKTVGALLYAGDPAIRARLNATSAGGSASPPPQARLFTLGRKSVLRPYAA